MNHLNDPENPLYINALKRTENIEETIKKSRINCLVNPIKIIGEVEEILQHLKGGPAKNLINSFFKYTTDKCDNCKIEKSKTIQLDRAHCNKENCDRSSLLKQSILIYFKDNETPISIRDILKTFIKLHSKIPLFILCKKCHNTYDRK